MAERIAKKMAKSSGMKDVKFSSCGLRAKKENITENASKALKALGYDGRDRKSVLFKKPKPKVLYVTVTNQHKQYVDSKSVLSFEDLAGGVTDPYGQDLETYLKTAKQIEDNVSILLEKIKKLRGEI
jgi:protein-tyrosine-phosphatase